MTAVDKASTPENNKHLRLTPKISQTHLTILAKTMLQRAKPGSVIRVLDIGCGDAHLLAHLAQILPEEYPGHGFEFYGFEVGDIGWHGEEYLRRTVKFLNTCAPAFEWEERISLLSASDRWPYESGAFDLIISNQVLEHVQDHSLLFGEIQRCLAPKGVSLHLFPLKSTIYEVHAYMPVVHWIRDGKKRRKLMYLFAKAGFRKKYREEVQIRGWTNLGEFATIYSDVLSNMTNYKSSQEIAALAKRAGLRPEFSYTKDFFMTKMLSVIGRQPQEYRSLTWLDRVTFPMLKRVASVTLILQQANNRITS
jgi:SAM-dependent methyltransferase